MMLEKLSCEERELPHLHPSAGNQFGFDASLLKHKVNMTAWNLWLLANRHVVRREKLKAFFDYLFQRTSHGSQKWAPLLRSHLTQLKPPLPTPHGHHGAASDPWATNPSLPSPPDAQYSRSLWLSWSRSQCQRLVTPLLRSPTALWIIQQIPPPLSQPLTPTWTWMDLPPWPPSLFLPRPTHPPPLHHPWLR